MFLLEKMRMRADGVKRKRRFGARINEKHVWKHVAFEASVELPDEGVFVQVSRRDVRVAEDVDDFKNRRPFAPQITKTLHSLFEARSGYDVAHSAESVFEKSLLDFLACVPEIDKPFAFLRQKDVADDFCFEAVRLMSATDCRRPSSEGGMRAIDSGAGDCVHWVSFEGGNSPRAGKRSKDKKRKQGN